MSTWLVDAHALLWFLQDDAKLSAVAKATMESAASVLLVSTATVWEIAIKTSLGKLTVPDDLPSLIEAEGFDVLPLSAEHGWAVRALPKGIHRDPFDRVLVAQAAVEGVGIISRDAQLDAYGVKRHW